MRNASGSTPVSAAHSSTNASCANEFGNAETPRSHDARTSGARSSQTKRRCAQTYGDTAVRSPISNTRGSGAIVPVSSAASSGASFDG